MLINRYVIISSLPAHSVDDGQRRFMQDVVGGSPGHVRQCECKDSGCGKGCGGDSGSSGGTAQGGGPAAPPIRPVASTQLITRSVGVLLCVLLVH